MQTLIAFEDAQRLVLHAARPTPAERVPLADALGRTLAEPVVSRDTIPPFASSAMDGFAVRAADCAAVPVVLAVIEDVPAGRVPERAVERGTCARIMTGAPVPEGADAIVPVEGTEPAEGGRVRVRRAPEAGQHVRPAGQDVREGERAFEAGTVVTPPVVGMLATLGVADVPVRRPPLVAVVATGDELVGVAETPGPGQIRDSNGPALATQVMSAGGAVLGPFVARDAEASVRAVLERAREADVVLVAGGVSMGERDLVRRALDALGWTPVFWKVRQRPGKPLAFGLLDGRPVLGLPGNPVSAAVCFEQYARPLLAASLGRRPILRPRVPAVLEAPTPKTPGLYTFARGRARVAEDGRLVVRDTGPQASNLYSSVARADGLIHLPEAWEAAPTGTAVAFEWLPWSDGT